MAWLTVEGSEPGDGLRGLLLAPDIGPPIAPGDTPSYQTCKAIYSYHPLGAKLAEIPIKLAQSKKREIAIPGAPEDRVKERFVEQWEQDGCEKHLFNLHRLKRIYGVAALACLTVKDGGEIEVAEPLDYESLWKATIAFNVFDPLNVAGSLVGNLDPNSPGFLKTTGIAVNGKAYHRSRSVIALNEEPIYLEWTSSAFGYVGRSVYQRTLFPLKSFIQTMITDDMVAKKAGVIVATLKQAGSIIDKAMLFLFGRKREVIKEAATGNVISISPDEKIESLNLQNVNAAMDMSRKHILENIAAGAGMPAILVNSETYVEGFGEGTEDANAVADFIEGQRDEMAPSYAWMDRIIQYRAWNPEWYKTIQAEFPDEYGKVDFVTATTQWRNAFKAPWPALRTEPPSKLAEVDDIKLKALIAVVEVTLPAMDPANRAVVIQFLADNMNALEQLFPFPLNLDYDALAEYEPPTEETDELHEPHEPKPFASQDADVIGARVRKAITKRSARKDETQGIAALATVIGDAVAAHGKQKGRLQ